MDSCPRKGQKYTGPTHFSKVCCTLPLRFYKRPTLVPIFVNLKKPGEDFFFYKIKKVKNENSFFALCQLAYERFHKNTLTWVAGGTCPSNTDINGKMLAQGVKRPSLALVQEIH